MTAEEQNKKWMEEGMFYVHPDHHFWIMRNDEIQVTLTHFCFPDPIPLVGETNDEMWERLEPQIRKAHAALLHRARTICATMNDILA